MKPYTLFVLALAAIFLCAEGRAQQQFTYRTVDTGYVIPWEIEFGPDGWLWISERAGYVSRLNLETGERRVLLDLGDSVLFERVELGMMGFTWHPDFPDSPYVYVASNYGTSPSSTYRLVERFRYENDSLVDPVEINRLDPGFEIHQGCRLKIGQDRKLYVTTGDSPGADLAVEDSNIVGKVLRLNLDGSIPEDNPIPGTYTFTKGHRNVQGWVQLPDGTIFTSEHGNITEDEVNRLVPGSNYGWPFVEGVCDDPWELDYCDSAQVVEPVWSSGINGTVAPCGLEYYNHDLYPALKNSLLLMTLKNSAIYQLSLNEDHTRVTSTTVRLQRSVGRLRDIAIASDGRIFLCTSNRELNAYFPFPMAEDDRIIELIPVPDGATPVLGSPDTVYVKAPVHFEHRFPIPVSNTGDGNLRIIGLYNMNESVPIRGDQWRLPVVVAPESAYDIAGMFFPAEEGSWVGQLRIATATQGNRDVYVVGSTAVGMLDAAEDTVLVVSPPSFGKTVLVTYTNTGSVPVELDQAAIIGPNAENYTVVSFPSGQLDPGEDVSVHVRFTPETSGIYEGWLTLACDAYRADSVYLLGSTEPVSVHEDHTAPAIQAFPNPFSSSIGFVIPSPLAGGMLTIVDHHGREVMRSAINGRSVLSWDGRDTSGTAVGSGVYYVIVSGTSGTSTLMIQHLE